MAIQVVWTRVGEMSLEEAHDYIAAEDPDAADDFLAGIFEVTDLLERFPYIGARWERGGSRTRVREVQYQRFRIFYRVDRARERVYIMRVWHASRDEPSFPE